MRIKIISLLGLLCSFYADAETAIICESCSSESAAESFAKSKSNPLECSPTFGENVSCQSRNKIVTFVDANSGKAYKYNVYHESEAPWEVKTERIALSADRKESFSILMEYINNTNASILEASTNFNQLIGSNSLNHQYWNNTNSSQESCPGKTALSTLTNPNDLDYIQTRASIEIGTRMISKNNHNNLNPTKINNSWSLSFKGLNSSIISESATRNPSFVVTFNESERPGSRKDFFAYNIDIIGFDEQNIPIMNFSLSDSSQVAGYSLGALKGNNGPLEITNKCVQQRFNEAVDVGILTSTSTSVGGGSGGGTSERPPSGGGTYQPSCQIVQFYQSGALLYVFRICN